MVGSIVLSVTFTINRCLLARYSAAVMLKTSVTFTVVVIGSEATPPELMAVIVNVTEIGAAGALKETVALVGPVGVITKLSRAGAPAWLMVQASGVAAGTLGSEPVTLNEPAAPEITD